MAEYIRCFSSPESVHASCEDYRAAASIDLRHDEEDIDSKLRCPLLVLWGTKGFVQRTYDVLNVWRTRTEQVEGRGIEWGHFLPEEAPDEVTAELFRFFVYVGCFLCLFRCRAGLLLIAALMIDLNLSIPG